MFVNLTSAETKKIHSFNTAHIIRVVEGQPNVTRVISTNDPNGLLVIGAHVDVMNEITREE